MKCRDPLNVEKLLDTRINAAIKLRNNLGLPSSNTNAFRLVNSEGDRYLLSFLISSCSKLLYLFFLILTNLCRLSGLIVDVFGDLAVVASSVA